MTQHAQGTFNSACGTSLQLLSSCPQFVPLLLILPFPHNISPNSEHPTLSPPKGAQLHLRNYWHK